MKTVRYACTHCGRKFEAEEKDVLECPGCFWSTSVKREEDVRESSAPAAASSEKSAFKLSALPLKQMAGAVLLIFFVFIVLKTGIPLFKKMGQGAKNISEKASQSKAEKKEKQAKERAASMPGAPASAAIPGLSPEEQTILNKRVQISLERSPGEEEQKVLSNRASFKSGFSEKLPSQAWTIENFKEMIAQQEKFYQVPLPRSYKNKLYDLFNTKYAAGAEAFKTGDLIKARNLWVESLAFPIYANNPDKHRGVVLTMARPFINDTLSKVGVINSAASEKIVRDKEQAVLASYEKLFTVIDQKAWPEALAAIAELNQKIDAFANPSSLAGVTEPYPASINQVDRDIQATLQGLLTVPPPAVSDLEPLKIDVFRKKRIIEGFIPDNVKAMQQKYDEGMDAVTRGDWAAAEKSFKEVDLPAELYMDAQDKIKILKKIQKSAGASSGQNP